LQRVACGDGSGARLSEGVQFYQKGHFEHYTVQNWQKLATVHKLKQFFCWKTPWK